MGEFDADNQTLDELAQPSPADEPALEADEDGLDEGDDTGNEPPEDDSEEVDYEGQKFRVPKALKDALLRQSDYTRKTQEVADQRKALEAQQAAMTQQAQAQAEYLDDIADVRALDKQLEQYGKVDWQRFSQDDPAAAQAAWFQFQQMKDERAAKVSAIQQKHQQREAETQQNFAKRVEQIRSECAKTIPNWSLDTETAIVKYAVERGYKPEQLRNISSRDMEELYFAKLGRELSAKQRAAAAPAKAEAKPVTQVGTGTGKVTKDISKMTMDEYAEHMNRLERKKARR